MRAPIEGRCLGCRCTEEEREECHANQIGELMFDQYMRGWFQGVFWGVVIGIILTLLLIFLLAKH